MDIVVFGQQNWDLTWTEKQQFATRLSTRGHRVLYVDPSSVVTSTAGLPLRLLRAPRRGELRELSSGKLWVLTLEHLGTGHWSADGWRRRRAVRRAALRLGFHRPAVLTLYPPSLVELQRLRPSGIVYFAVDEWTGFYDDPLLARAIRAEEEALLRESDVVIGISPRLQRRFSDTHPHSYRVTNAVDAATFAPERLSELPAHPRIAQLPHPRIGLIGQIDRRVDPEILGALAKAHPEWQLVLVGRIAPDGEVQELIGRSNVHAIGFEPHARLPHVLRELDVCVIPYRLTPHTHSCNPAKAYEYLASGLPIVATPLEGLDELRGVIRTADTPNAFVREVECALADPSAGRPGRLALARRASWEERTDAVERHLHEAVERRTLRRAAARGFAATMPAPERRVAPRLDAKDDADRRLQRGFAGSEFSWPARQVLRAARVAGRLYWVARVLTRMAGGRRPWKVRRVMVVRRAFLGDLVVLMPTLAALRGRFPGARITLGVQRDFVAGDVLHGTGLVDEIRVVELPETAGRWRRALDALRLFARGYDVVIHGVSFFLIREALFAGAPRTLGLDDGHPVQDVLDVSVPLQPFRHEADNNLAIVEALGALPPPAERVPQLSSDVVRGMTDDVLQRLGISIDVPIVVIHPGTKRPSRRWPEDRFAALATRLLCERPSLRVVLTGTSSEASLAASIRERVPPELRARIIDAVGQCSITELRALLSCCRALVSNDTGVMHVARAQGTPLLALLGPENDRRWGPTQLGPAPAVSIRREVPCAPCGRWDCEQLYCMRALSVADAHEALTTLLAAGPAGNADAADLVPLRRQHRRLDWTALASAGFSLPLVSVIVADAGDAANAARLLGEQDYPRLELLLARHGVAENVRTTDTDPGSGRFERLQVVDGTSMVQALVTALRSARGEFVAVELALSSMILWPADRLSRNVAALMRSPLAPLTSAVSAPLADIPGIDAARGASGRTFRRDALLAAVLRETTGEYIDAGALLDRATRELLAEHFSAVSHGIATPPSSSDVLQPLATL